MSELEFLRAATLDAPGLVHAFTTRHGGVSEGPYASLNLTWKDGDDKTHVEENRRRVTQALGLDRLVFANQVHGNAVLKVDAAPQGVWSAGEGDALITDIPGLGLVTQTADCVPVLLYDPARPAIAAIHSGWRGTVRNVAGAAIAAMATAYGSKPAALKAAIGPAIGQAHYRVGPEVLEQFLSVFGSLHGLAGPRDAEGGAKLDNTEAVRRQLVAAGLQPSNIETIAACTFADARFFSCRRARGAPFGGQGGIIGLV